MSSQGNSVGLIIDQNFIYQNNLNEKNYLFFTWKKPIIILHLDDKYNL